MQIVGGRTTLNSSSDGIPSIPSYVIRDSGATSSNPRMLQSPVVVIEREVFSDGDITLELKERNVKC